MIGKRFLVSAHVHGGAQGRARIPHQHLRVKGLMEQGLAVAARREIARDHDLLGRDHLAGHVAELSAVVLLHGRVIAERPEREDVRHHAEQRVVSLFKKKKRTK
jgi:hypothetical protein